MYLSEPFKPYFSGITKDYIFLYSTDHAGSRSIQNPQNGAIGWGECDLPDLTGYVDKGIIIMGYQSETPSLLINPNDPIDHNIWLFYHPFTHSDAGNRQQTRLLTTSGGISLNQTTYIDRGRVLGITPNEQANYNLLHTGYSDAYLESDGSITVIHVTRASWPYYLSKSICVGNNYTFTRIDENIDITSFMPFERMVHHSPSLFFKRNGMQYMAARNVTFIVADIGINNFISIFQCDGNYHPTALFRNISTIDSGSDTSNAGYFIDESNDPDTLHIYYIKNKTQMFHTTWDLRNLD
jgi:hypothetical protein